MGIDSWRDIALWRLMMAAAAAGLRYDPVVEHRGRDHLDAALGSGRGILLAAPHSLLGYVLLRLLRDRGGEPVAIASGLDVPIFGTADMARIIPVSPTLLAEAVRTLREGGTLCAMIDRPGPEPNAFESPTPLGPLYVSDALLRFALRERASILYCTVRVEKERLRATWSSPPATPTAETIGRDFAAFVAARIAEGHGRDGPRAQALSRPGRAAPAPQAGAAPEDRSGKDPCSSHSC
jgi:lauroyl/myristoyl acyltransferase